ncbi:unnamed protein product, partial [Discosporangium mesarthrocarpum]
LGLGPATQSGAGHEGGVVALCWHPSGEVVASSGQDMSVWLWSTGGQALSAIDTHRRWSAGVAFSGQGDALVSCGRFTLEGWATRVRVSCGQGQVATMAWRQPGHLTAARAKISGASGLSTQAAQALRDHGATDWGSAASAALAVRGATAGPGAGTLAQAVAAWGYTAALAELWSSAGGASALRLKDGCGRSALHYAVLGNGAGPAAAMAVAAGARAGAEE